MELRHWESDIKFKYVAKVPVGKKSFRYFYTNEAYQAYLKEKSSSASPSISNQAKNANVSVKSLSTAKNDKKTTIKDFISGLGEKISDVAEDIVSDGKEWMFRTFKKEEYERKQEWTKRAEKKAAEEAKETARKQHEYRKQMEALEQNNPLRELNHKMKGYSAEEDMAAVNPNYETKNYAYTHNCFNCTMAYELRRRGYDVEASEKLSNDKMLNTNLTVKRVFKDVKMMYASDMGHVETSDVSNRISKILGVSAISKETIENTKKTMIEMGNGARGILGVTWTAGSGHAVNWEVKNGTVILRDSQTNDVYTLDDIMSRSNDFYFARLDNLEPTNSIYSYIHNKDKTRRR